MLINHINQQIVLIVISLHGVLFFTLTWKDARVIICNTRYDIRGQKALFQNSSRKAPACRDLATKGSRESGGIEGSARISIAASLLFSPAFFVLAPWRCLFQNPSGEKIVCDYPTRIAWPFTSRSRVYTLPRASR